AFAQAELDYRQQRVRAEYPARASRQAWRIRLAALFQPRRRPNPAPRRPMPAPHHLTSQG
ncbi:MAG TPA: hypothetical protein VHE56_09535, partial [Mycobacteriales bacterium]|nr:hypothetical protein [Mycobacteriales bacterium]